MRDIKFRGMDIEGRWFYGLLAILPNGLKGLLKPGSYISNKSGAAYAYRVRPETVGQYIGLKDRSGADIYEGDIMTGTLRNGKYNATVIIEYHAPSFEVRIIVDGVKCGFIDFDHKILNDFEVIGNIHEYPQLINKQ